MFSALMYEEYCKQQHDGVKYIGKLYNLEFMVNPKRDEKEPRGSEKTVCQIPKDNGSCTNAGR